jgi:hypothetical protein
MRILADFHHADLFESHLLIADRFGWDVWRPIGMEWFTEDIWQFEREWHGDAVARQYLSLWDTDVESSEVPGVFYRQDGTHPGRTFRMITLAAAREMEWDAVLSSVPANDPGLWKFAREVGARFGVHLGNEGQQSRWDLADFAWVSTALPYRPPVKSVTYRQPFSLEDFRHEWPPSGRATVASFVQCFPENVVPYGEYLDLARTAPDLTFQVYGAYGSHPLDEFACGNLETTPAVADAMRAARTIWHSKSWSDGYGHVIHNAFAVGRPVVGRAGYYRGKMAEPLWVEGVTSFDIDRRSQAEVVALLRRLRDDDEYHRQISLNAALRFREVVDFDGEADEIRRLMEDVCS